jgi:hypothetical protein
MRRLALILLAVGCNGAHAQRVPLPCGPLPEAAYGKCLRESAHPADRAHCTRLLELDMKEIDDWQQCRQLEIDADAVRQRESVAAMASQARALLVMRVRTQSVR